MNQERIMQVLLAPHVSEKSTLVADHVHQYVFKVLPNASKAEIKKAVELMFSVQVMQVRALNQRGKHKRHRHHQGRRASWKKAYVKLAPDHDINFAAAE